MRDVVDLTPAIAAACDAMALAATIPTGGERDLHRLAEIAVRAAAPVLGITDVGSISEARIREPLPQSRGVETVPPHDGFLFAAEANEAILDAMPPIGGIRRP